MIAKEEWVIDNAKTRSFDGKRLNIVGKGIFMMHVRDTGEDGKKRPGFVQVWIEPYDFDAALNIESL